MSPTVVIVGAGPIGLMLACELGLAGVRTIVLERRTGTDLRSPAMAINGATVELLDQRGLLDALREHSMELPAAHFANLWLDLTPLTERHEASLIVPQWRIERRLEEHATGLGVEVRRGVEVIGLAQDGGCVTVTVRAGTEIDTVTGRYLVGCDGWESTVRELAGIGFPVREPAFYGLIGDLEADWADLLPEQVGAYYCPVGGTYAGTPTEPGVCRIATAEWGVSPPDPSAPVTLEELNTRVRRLTGTEFKTARVRWLARTRNPSANADAYRSGRVFLAGDAAHVFFPFNGQRLSAGFQDAVNLGWKLAADLRGDAPAGLLDSYQDERRPAGEWACANVAAQEALVHPPETAGPLRTLFTQLIGIEGANRHLAETVMGLSVRYPMGATDDPLLGARLPHVPLTTPDGVTTVARLLHRARGVLLRLSGDADAPGHRDRVDVVAAEPTPHIEAGAVLLRPDGHVAWTDTAERDGTGPALDDALRTWFGAPAR
ncbi:MAG TPA: FAD-dependent monooxygenase [Thermomonospora sp.]|nr:FAD-dependent monooxygenase [Thermomonospora sp.]